MMAEMAVAMPLMLAGEQNLFHFPSPDEVRVQPISRAEHETGWAFSVDDGMLTCVWSGGRRIVFFFEGRPSDLDEQEAFQPRGVIVTTDPIQLTIGNMANSRPVSPRGKRRGAHTARRTLRHYGPEALRPTGRRPRRPRRIVGNTMLLIRCPYCEEERPELEFRNAGEAHIARSANMSGESDDDFEKFFFIRSNPKGIIYERWRHIHGCARFFNAVRDTVTDKFIMTYKAGEPKPAKLPGVVQMSAAFRIPGAGRLKPGKDGPLQLRRPVLCRHRGRHAGLGAARQRRASGRPLVQVPPAARLPVRRRGRAQRAGRDQARRGAQDAECARHRAGAL